MTGLHEQRSRFRDKRRVRPDFSLPATFVTGFDPFVILICGFHRNPLS
jgi:hypothetical protein